MEVSSFLGCDSGSMRKWFSTYLCIPAKFALLIIDFHGSIHVLEANIWMVNKVKATCANFDVLSGSLQA